MSSTEDEKVAEFWRSRLGPAATALKKRGASLLDDARDGSSWTAPDRDAQDLEDLTIEAASGQLRERLENAGLTELASLVPALLELAEELKPSAEPDQEIDPYVYVMH